MLTSFSEQTACALILFPGFLCHLPHPLPPQDINTKHHLHAFCVIQVLHLCFFFFISFPLSLLQFYSTDHSWKPAELYFEFIIQLRFFNSHILPTDGSNWETLSERTDHLCPYHKLLSPLPPLLKTNRWNSSYVHSQLTHSTLYLFPYRSHLREVKYVSMSEAWLFRLIFSDAYRRERKGAMVCQ